MWRFSVSTRHPALALAMLILTASLVPAGDFAVSSRNEYRIKRSELQAVQHLARATFGYTMSDVDTLAARIRQIGHKNALAEWIDDQINDSMEHPVTLHEPRALQMMLNEDGYSTPYVDRPSGAYNRNDYRDFAWWDRALNAPDQLRQRMAFALMQIVVINRDANIFGSNAKDNMETNPPPYLPRYMGIVHYYDMLIQNAFGDYRTVLGDVAYHPVMGVFLTHKDNKKPSSDGLLLPDENFAREILQLFTMGEYRTDISGVQVKDRAGNLVQNYTNEDIKALARVFTGLRYAQNRTNLHAPMVIWTANDHDFNEKVFPTLRFTLPSRSSSIANANAEINEAIDTIYQHPNVGPYIAHILIQRFVKANPSTTYIRDVATVFNDNGLGERGDLEAVIKAILCHKEALRSQRYIRIRSGGQITGLRVRTRGTEHTKLVEPDVRYAQFIKMFDGQPATANGYRLNPNSLDVSQLPYRAPSVFNYFRPDHQPPGYQNYRTSRSIPNGRLNSPEMQIYTPVFANRFQNLIDRHLHTNISDYNRLDFSGSYGAETTLAANGRAARDFSELLERLDLLICHGSLSEQSKTVINNALVNAVDAGNSNDGQLARLAISGVFGTPESAIDE